MPYSSNDQLPESVQHALPEHAQSIYRKAFNSAHEQYNDEVTCHKVAWGAVKKEYEKDASGNWVKK